MEKIKNTKGRKIKKTTESFKIND